MRLALVLAVSITVSGVIAATVPRASVSSGSRLGSVTPGPAMFEPRSGHTATLLPDGRVLIVGGMRRNQEFYKSAESYDPVTRKFQPAGEMDERRVGHVAVLLRSGKVLIAGGWVGHGCTDSAELYDPGTRMFSAVAKMTACRGNPSATLLSNGDVLIAGGADHDAPGGISSAEIFRADTQSFHAVRPMHFARVSHTATLLTDGRVLIVGGRGERVNASAELFDPRTQTFAETGSLLTARYKHGAGLLADGRVLIMGGSDERDWNGTLQSAEIYDPSSGKFSRVSPMNYSRFKLPEHAIRLSSGKVLVAGGSKQVEVFDPVSAKFSVVSGELTGPWHFMTATKLNDGSVLLAGGYPENDRATDQTWIYRP